MITNLQRFRIILSTTLAILSWNFLAQAAITYPKVSGAAAPFDVATFSSSTRPAFGDVDGDGVEDLVAVSAYDPRYYQKNSDGNFVEQTENSGFSTVDCSYSCTPSLYDLSGDGLVDLIIGDGSNILYYINNGDETFTQKTGADNPFEDIDVGTYVSPTLFDVNGDGKVDLVVGEYSGTINYFVQTDTGTFENKTDSATENPFYGIDVGAYSNPVFFDVNNDGATDLVIGSYGWVSYYQNSDGVYTKKTASDNPFDDFDESYTMYIAFFDCTGDGQKDLVRTTSQGLGCFANNSGVFSAIEATENLFSDFSSTYSTFFYDYDGDGDNDMIYTNNSVTVGYAQKTESGYLVDSTTYVTPFSSLFLNGGFLHPFFTDVNEDGSFDLVLGTYNGILHYYQNNGDNTFTKITDSTNPFLNITRSSMVDPAFYDLSGDGKDDLILCDYDGQILYYIKNADNSFTLQTGASDPFASISGVYYSLSPFLYDVNGDGSVDLILGEEDGTIKYYQMDATGVFTKVATDSPFASIDVGSYSTVQFYDLTEDGAPDLIVGDGYGTFSTFVNDGTGSTFTAATSNPFSGIDVGRFADPAFFDVNKDGNIDLIAGKSSNDKLYYYNGNDSLSSFTLVSDSANPFIFKYPTYPSAVLEDINDDGSMDLVVGDSLGLIYVYAGNGDGTYTEKTGADNPFSDVDMDGSSNMAFVDLDKNGTNDVVFGGEDEILHYFVKDSASAFVEKTGADNPFASITATGDYMAPAFFDVNGDTAIDLVLGNGNGKISYYQNNGSSVFTEQTGNNNPFDHIDVGSYAKPTFEDINGDGLKDIVITRLGDDIYVYLAVDDAISTGDDDDDDTPPATGDDDDSGTTPPQSGGDGGNNPAENTGNTGGGAAQTGDDDDTQPTAAASGGGCSLHEANDTHSSLALLGAAILSLGILSGLRRQQARF